VGDYSGDLEGMIGFPAARCLLALFSVVFYPSFGILPGDWKQKTESAQRTSQTCRVAAKLFEQPLKINH
jgi:hypothetical protein